MTGLEFLVLAGRPIPVLIEAAEAIDGYKQGKKRKAQVMGQIETAADARGIPVTAEDRRTVDAWIDSTVATRNFVAAEERQDAEALPATDARRG